MEEIKRLERWRDGEVHGFKKSDVFFVLDRIRKFESALEGIIENERLIAESMATIQVNEELAEKWRSTDSKSARIADQALKGKE